MVPAIACALYTLATANNSLDRNLHGLIAFLDSPVSSNMPPQYVNLAACYIIVHDHDHHNHLDKLSHGWSHKLTLFPRILILLHAILHWLFAQHGHYVGSDDWQSRLHGQLREWGGFLKRRWSTVDWRWQHYGESIWATRAQGAGPYQVFKQLIDAWLEREWCWLL